MVSEKDLQSYLKVAASALPCREARKEFSSYVHNVAHDISIENPDADFATVASLLGTTPKQVAADFVESQSPQTISRWNRSAHRYKYGLQLLVGIIVVVLFSVVIFFTTTKGVMIVNTETTYTDLGEKITHRTNSIKWQNKNLNKLQRSVNMTKTLKRVIALLSVSMFMALFSLSCFAQENSSAKKIYTEDLGDGITAVVTLSETNGMARSSKTYNVTKEYYKDGTYIGVATLYASFYYDGSSASATAASGAGAGSNGWSYGDQKTWTSGNGAYLNATLSKNGTFIPVSLALRCDARGNVS